MKSQNWYKQVYSVNSVKYKKKNMKSSHLALWKQTNQLTDQSIFNKCVDILYAHLVYGYCLKRQKFDQIKLRWSLWPSNLCSNFIHTGTLLHGVILNETHIYWYIFLVFFIISLYTTEQFLRRQAIITMLSSSWSFSSSNPCSCIC